MTADRAALRRRYAERMTAPLRDADPRIRETFAKVPREDFLGPPPWYVLSGLGGERRTSDIADLYQDVLVSLDPERGVNNGSPSLHARMLQLLDVAPGETVLHAGAGSGYYTALLAELTGPEGRVTAVEFGERLARAARANLTPWPWVAVEHGDAAAFPTAPTRRIYVNFGLAQPADAWLDQLETGGTLVLPLAVPAPGNAIGRHSGRGAVLVVRRVPAGYAACFDTPVAFVFAEGATAGDAALRAGLWRAFGRGGLETVRSLHRRELPAAEAWFSSTHFSLGTTPV